MNWKNKLFFLIFCSAVIFFFFKFKGIPESKLAMENCLTRTNQIKLSFALDKKVKSQEYKDESLQNGIHIAKLINSLESLDNSDLFFEITCKKITRKVFFSKETFNENITIQNILQLLS